MIAIVLRGAGWSAITGLTACACAVGGCGVLLVHEFIGPPLLASAFALLAAASAFAVDEPANAVVDVTPTSPAAQTAARSVALAMPLCGGISLVMAAAMRTTTLPTPGLGLALVGNVLLGFAIASVARLWTGEPGVWASAAAVFVLIVPSIYGPVARWVHTFPVESASSEGIPLNTWWWLAGTTSLVSITIAAGSDRAYHPTRGAPSLLHKLRRQHPPPDRLRNNQKGRPR